MSCQPTCQRTDGPHTCREPTACVHLRRMASCNTGVFLAVSSRITGAVARSVYPGGASGPGDTAGTEASPVPSGVGGMVSVEAVSMDVASVETMAPALEKLPDLFDREPTPCVSVIRDRLAAHLRTQ